MGRVVHLGKRIVAVTKEGIHHYWLPPHGIGTLGQGMTNELVRDRAPHEAECGRAASVPTSKPTGSGSGAIGLIGVGFADMLCRKSVF